jgi:hypothetical protein
MDDVLASLKAKGELEPDADARDLRREILDWYDGYNWLGSENVLNPYSILNFFAEKTFKSYWTETGRPSHLSAMIKENPLDFLQPKLDGYLSETIRKVALGQFKPVPVLFHSGYLTIDKVSKVEGHGKKSPKIDSYSFKLPNAEVSVSYDLDLFSAVFGENNIDDLLDDKKNVLEAFEKKDADSFAKLFSGKLSRITFHQHTDEEKFYHVLARFFLDILGFTLLDEVAGAIGRSDIVVFLPDNKRAIIIEVKYKAAKDKDTEAAIKKTLTKALNEAEKAIIEKDYAGPLRRMSKEIIGLGLVVYGRNIVGARFINSSALKNPPKPTGAL